MAVLFARFGSSVSAMVAAFSLITVPDGAVTCSEPMNHWLRKRCGSDSRRLGSVIETTERAENAAV